MIVCVDCVAELRNADASLGAEGRRGSWNSSFPVLSLRLDWLVPFLSWELGPNSTSSQEQEQEQEQCVSCSSSGGVEMKRTNVASASTWGGRCEALP